MFVNSVSFARRAGAVVALGGLGLIVGASGAFAAPSITATAPVVTPQDDPSGCQGILPTPGSENTSKTLVGGSMQPGGTAVFSITYPFDASAVGQQFTITDCVYIGGKAAQKYAITFVPNNTSYTFEYALEIPDDTPLGVEYCNYAKTTAGPSDPQASNRKSGGACFNVGGSLRVEKRAGSATGALLPGATFSVSCDAAADAQPPVVVDGLDAAGVATTGAIGINGPEGTACDVTEVAAPDGYDLASPATHHLTIPRGTAATVDTFVNTETVAGCPEGTESDGEGGCVTPTEEPSIEPTIDPTEEPTEEPTVEPTDEPEPTGTAVEPGDPHPSISPTVLGVKIVRPPALPRTGAPTGVLLAVGLGLVVLGAGMVARGEAYGRRH